MLQKRFTNEVESSSLELPFTSVPKLGIGVIQNVLSSPSRELLATQHEADLVGRKRAQRFHWKDAVKPAPQSFQLAPDAVVEAEPSHGTDVPGDTLHKTRMKIYDWDELKH
jgi:hypothetical protein